MHLYCYTTKMQFTKSPVIDRSSHLWSEYLLTAARAILVHLLFANEKVWDLERKKRANFVNVCRNILQFWCQGGDLGEQWGTVLSKVSGGGDETAYIPQNFRSI